MHSLREQFATRPCHFIYVEHACIHKSQISLIFEHACPMKRTFHFSNQNRAPNVNKSRFLCTHKILVHAQHSCACTTLLCMHWRGQGPRPGPNEKAAAGPARGGCFFVESRPWAMAPPVHARECCAYTRVLCMHKNLAHPQQS